MLRIRPFLKFFNRGCILDFFYSGEMRWIVHSQKFPRTHGPLTPPLGRPLYLSLGLILILILGSRSRSRSKDEEIDIDYIYPIRYPRLSLDIDLSFLFVIFFLFSLHITYNNTYEKRCKARSFKRLVAVDALDLALLFLFSLIFTSLEIDLSIDLKSIPIIYQNYSIQRSFS